MTAGERGRVLIVDDEVLIRQGIKHYLNWEQEGFEVVGEASHGVEALEMIEVVRPHIIITDIAMPIMDGEELTRIVKERFPSIEVIVLSSYGDFDYVRSTFQSGVVDYILKPKLDAEGLLNVLKKAASRIPSLKSADRPVDGNPSIEQMITKLISGYQADYDSAQLSAAFPNPRFCLLGVNLKSGQAELPNDVKKKMTTGLTEHNYSFYFEKKIVVVNGEDFSRLIHFAKNLAESEAGLRFALSEEFVDFSKIGNVYKEELFPLLNYQFYFPEQRILTKEDLPKLPPKFENFNLDWFTSEFKRQHFESAFDYLQEHVNALSACYTTDVYEYKSFFGNIIFNILILLSNMEYDVRELEQDKYTYFKAFEDAHSAVEAVEKLAEFIAEAKKTIHTSAFQPENDQIKKILDYLNDHYTEPLTLTGVAQYFHFNPSYLSSYFSTHHGEGFIEYLNRIRIEEATKLLIQGTARISEISGMVGYSDHSYFCKVFKKIKGLSPSQFRRKQLM
ncbi:response regulator transcription factor [Neobacillus drentensis]|uniref:response regulator transcription factor n=1 Tax=Neobacillus drentensis TaxID=220684 RepID=UPI001F17E5C2|nr:response regulator transcription factor [Neobacillus drentensis]ULT56630.1 response regulator transcription factor [Neobacillus drentensis]